MPTLKKRLPEYLLIILGGIVTAFNYHLFIVENQFAPAGINGIATMVQYKLGFSIGYMSLLINVPLCILAYCLRHRAFAIRSFIFTLSYSFSYLLLGRVDLGAFVYRAEGIDTILPTIVAGTIAGAVYGITFRAGGSSGGTDIISHIISKKYPRFNFFWVTFVINVAVAMASYFVYAEIDPETGALMYQFKPVVLCILYSFMASEIGSLILQASKSAVKFEIVTTHAAEIAAEMDRKINRSTTLLHGEGMHTHSGRDVLICIVNHHEEAIVAEIIRSYDNTFAYVEPVTRVVGRFYQHKTPRIVEEREPIEK